MTLELTERDILYLVVNLVGFLGILMWLVLQPLTITGGNTMIMRGEAWELLANLFWNCGEFIMWMFVLILIITDYTYFRQKYHLDRWKIGLRFDNTEEKTRMEKRLEKF